MLLWEHLRQVFRRSFAKFSWRPDLWLGVVIALLTTSIQIGMNLAAQEDWDRRPLALLLSIFAPVPCVIVLDAARRTVRALWWLYRQRKQPSFRKPVQIGVVVFVALTCSGFWFAHLRERNRPHLAISVGHFYIGKIAPSQTRVLPASTITIETFVNDSGVPTTVSNWRLDATLTDRETVLGVPNYRCENLHPYTDDNGFMFRVTPEMLIFGTKLISNSISGYASFIFYHVSEDFLRTPGTMFKLSAQDANGTWYSHEFSVPAQEEPILLHHD